MRRIPLVAAIVVAAVLALATGIAVHVAHSKQPGTQTAVGQTAVYTCPMHPTYLSHQSGSCPICGMTLVQASEAGDNAGGVRIDPAMVQSIGVQTETAAVRTLTRDIRTSAVVVEDERRVASITTKVMGYVEKLHVNYTGQRVVKGQALYDLYSPDLVSAQSEYLQVFRNAALRDSGQLLRSARNRLLNWDITEAQIAELEKRGAPEKTMTVVSPSGGVVTEKMIVEGQNIEPGMPLYRVVDYSRVWVEGALYQQDVPLVRVGQRGTIQIDYYPAEQYSGTVTYVAPEMDRESRTLMVRLEVANTSDIRIKPGMNATVLIAAGVRRDVVSVSEQAVIHSGLRTLVVIAKGDGLFEPREVRIGQTAGGYTEISEGVQDGEEIVTSSQFSSTRRAT